MVTREGIMLIADGSVQIERLGRNLGNFHPTLSPEAPILYDIVRKNFRFSRLFLPKVNFTNRVAGMRDSNCFSLPDRPFIWRTRDWADGGIVINDSLTAIGVCNADCHLGVLYDPDGEMLCLLHLGLKCFYRPDGSPSVLQEALRLYDCDATDLYFWVGFGAGPCCYGHDLQHPEFGEKNRHQAENLRKFFGAQAVKGTVAAGPRKGWAAHDNLTMIINHADKLGFKDMEIDYQCTSCAGLDSKDGVETGERLYWSNLRGDVDCRNFFMARLTTR